MVSSSLFTGTVMHSRHVPVPHSFRYPVYYYSFDLDELPLLSKTYLWFSYNKKNIVALHDKDYLREQTGSIKEKALNLLKEFSYDPGKIDKIFLVTGARFLNYVFNPVSFFYCYTKDKQIENIIVEINNTFGERHVYILDRTEFNKFGRNPNLHNTRKEKSFHVSPFNDMEGEYDFHMADIENALDIRINILKDKKSVFNSRLWGAKKPLNNFTFLQTLASYPLAAVLSMPRILYQAAKLHYIKKLKVYKKPPPTSEFTIKYAGPRRRERIAMKYVFSFLSRAKVGKIIVHLPDGKVQEFGDLNASSDCAINVLNYNFFWRIVTSAAVGFGESYVEKEWQTEDLTAVISFLIDNKTYLDERKLSLSLTSRIFNRILHVFNKNTIKGSKKNIEDHYDLSNSFYELILDPSMMYSCAIFESGEESAEEAQRKKIRTMLDKAHLEKDSHLLEIGSGWGSLAITAAKDYGCRVTSITLSEEQLAYAKERARAESLSNQVNFQICDYRKLKGKFDRIVSVEMLEAVGEEYLGKFFKVCDNVLAADGIAVLQVITMPEERYRIYRKGSDWIQKHIFPGAIVPSLQVISNSIAKNTGFVIENVENIGPSYAPTLAFWRQNLINKRERITELGFDEKFIRKWEYYFSYCEAAFATRTLNVLQLVLTRPNNATLKTRDSFATRGKNNNMVKIRA